MSYNSNLIILTVGLKHSLNLAAVAHSVNPSSWEAGDLCEFEAILVYRVSSRIAKAIYRKCLEKKQTKNPQA